MREANDTRSIIDDRPLTPQEIQRLLRGESIWEHTDAPNRPTKDKPQDKKSIAV